MSEWQATGPVAAAFVLGTMLGGSIAMNAMTRWVRVELRKSIKWRHDTLAEIDQMIRDAGLDDLSAPPSRASQGAEG